MVCCSMLSIRHLKITFTQELSISLGIWYHIDWGWEIRSLNHFILNSGGLSYGRTGARKKKKKKVTFAHHVNDFMSPCGSKLQLRAHSDPL